MSIHVVKVHVVKVLGAKKGSPIPRTNFFKKSNNTRHNNQMAANQKHFCSSKKNKQITMTGRVLFMPRLILFYYLYNFAGSCYAFRIIEFPINDWSICTSAVNDQLRFTAIKWFKEMNSVTTDQNP